MQVLRLMLCIISHIARFGNDLEADGPTAKAPNWRGPCVPALAFAAAFKAPVAETKSGSEEVFAGAVDFHGDRMLGGAIE